MHSVQSLTHLITSSAVANVNGQHDATYQNIVYFDINLLIRLVSNIMHSSSATNIPILYSNNSCLLLSMQHDDDD